MISLFEIIISLAGSVYLLFLLNRWLEFRERVFIIYDPSFDELRDKKPRKNYICLLIGHDDPHKDPRISDKWKSGARCCRRCWKVL